MAVRQITTKLAVDGEAEFKRQLGEVNRALKNTGAEMKLVDAQFKGQANSAEALRAKQKLLTDSVAAQTSKVEALRQAVTDAAAAYGETDARTDKYRLQLINAERALVDFNRELEENAKYLKEAEESADGCATSIDKFGKEVKGAEEDAGGLSGKLGEIGETIKGLRNEDGSFNLKNVLGALGSLKGALVGGAIVTGAKAVKDAIFEIVDSTKEYRQIMGTLETSSQAAGYTTEQTAEAYGKLQSVLGDTQSAATATANLQAIGLEQEQLMFLIDEVIGAWATYGDSIPIDSLSESINETIQAGKVTGVFADALNWAGVSEDEFNERLAECANAAERAQLVLYQLSTQGLAETGQAWQENNEDLMRYNQAQEKMNASMARLGELLTPAAVAMLEFGSNVVTAAAEIVGAISDVIDKIIEAKQAFDELTNRDDATGTAAKAVKQVQSWGTEQMVSMFPFLDIPYKIYKGVKNISGSHAGGLDRVPYNGYIAELHEDEAVLNAKEAALWRSVGRYSAPQRSAVSSPVPASANTQSASQRESIVLDVTLEMDGATLARKQYTYNQAEAARRGTPLAGREGR